MMQNDEDFGLQPGLLNSLVIGEKIVKLDGSINIKGKISMAVV